MGGIGRTTMEWAMTIRTDVQSRWRSDAPYAPYAVETTAASEGMLWVR